MTIRKQSQMQKPEFYLDRSFKLPPTCDERFTYYSIIPRKLQWQLHELHASD